MARKRGGIAGFYDRNKGLIKTAVPAALSFVPGIGVPLAAGAGALIEGLDRPGKSGIGFDPYAALKGGAKGAVVGAGTQGARALLTGGGQFGSGSGLLNPQNSFSSRMGAADKLIGQANQQMLGGAAGQVAQGAMPAAANAATGMSFRQALKQPQVLGQGIQGLLGILPSAESRAMEARTDVDQQKMELERQRFDIEKQQLEEEKLRRQRLAALLMPYAQQQFPQYFGR